LAGAVAAYREALRLNPKDALAHYNLGNTLRTQGDLVGATAAYREALRHDPQLAPAHCNLGQALRDRGHFAAALEALRRGHELGSRQPGWPYPSAQWVRDAERLLALDARLPAVLAGTATPADAAERFDYARVCHYKHHYAAAARFYAEALVSDAKLADDLRARHGYNAACCAGLAAAGQGEDVSKLDTKERSRLRQQALTWLRANLADWQQRHQTNPAATQAAVRQTLARWQRDPDLAGLRDAPKLAKLPADEQEACRRLWADVEALLKKAP
jgi:tetratricopeptide (TPR) repeat protein